MTSNFARNHRLSQQTLDTYTRYGAHPRDAADRRYFYHVYLQDVVPDGVTVHHIHNGSHNLVREEIQLLTPSGRIFMSGLVGAEKNHHYTEKVAGEEAYNKWQDGYFIPDEQKWRFFTGLAKIRFFGSREDEKWDCKGQLDPIGCAQYVAAYLQQEYDKLGQH